MTWGVANYSTTPASNSNVNGINIAEGCNASNINDAIRQIMADIANLFANGQLLPSGVAVPFAGSAAPTGFFLCNGAAVSRTTYAALFIAIGTTYGAGDGSTTFNLPDYRGRSIVGAGAGTGLTSRVLAAIGGEETHLLTVAEVPALSVSGTTVAGGGHTPTLNDPGHTHTVAFGTDNSPNTLPGHGGTPGAPENTGSATTGITANAVPDHTHAFSANTSGGGGAHNNMHPFAVANFIIKI